MLLSGVWVTLLLRISCLFFNEENLVAILSIGILSFVVQKLESKDSQCSSLTLCSR